ncbi:hypothetical protein K3148_11470 [Qipengyuania aurantiaca]|uniref:Uncharacterized protein n=1 Tax=Qipengyuania aurantiaca TaxID=2867233 RepID=A0ABX8ZKG4_9SPHN|nr:hypothetical protein [Qipengyuania aurantiaca]QZD89424.1 hypothetical protein K3148_11470 [Qipengyuania aurantiaca]
MAEENVQPEKLYIVVNNEADDPYPLLALSIEEAHQIATEESNEVGEEASDQEDSEASGDKTSSSEEGGTSSPSPFPQLIEKAISELFPY